MRTNARPVSHGQQLRQADGLGEFFRGGAATRGALRGASGSSAPVHRWSGFLTLVLTLAVAVCGLGVQSAAAAGLNFELRGSFGPDGTAASGFSQAGPVAVDQSEETVYVLDPEAQTLFKFDLEGNPVPFGGSSPNISGNELSGLDVHGIELQIAVNPNTHTIYLAGGYNPIENHSESLEAYQSNGEPAIFTAGPGAGTNEITGFDDLRGIAVDRNGAIYAAGVEAPLDNHLNVYSESGELLLSGVGGSGLANIAVDGKGTLYVQENSETLQRLKPSEFPITPTTTYVTTPVTIHVKSVAVDPTTNFVYALVGVFGGVPRVSVFDEEGNPQATFGGLGQAGELGRSYGIAVASIEEPGIEGGISRPFVTEYPEAGLSQVKIFQEEVVVDAPTIEGSSALKVTADTATLRGKVNPNSRSTTYYFEYGREDCSLGTCTIVEPVNPDLGRGRIGVFGSVQLFGLEPGTTYHYRVVAENELGTTEGPDKTFTTQVSSLGFQLADSRAWEMVSPPEKGGVNLSMPKYQAIVRAAADGEGLAYASIGSLGAGGEGNRLPEDTQLLARREGDTWHTEDISPPHTEATGISLNAEYQSFNADLSQALLHAYDQTPLSPQADERTPYLRENSAPPVYTPLLSNKEGSANVPSGEAFGKDAIELQGANPALADVVLSTLHTPLIEGAPENSLYLWHADQITAISKKPADEGGEWAVAPLLGSGNGSVRHAISDDGSRVFWGAGGSYEGGSSLKALYLRYTETEESVRLDVPEPGVVGGEDGPVFQGANAEGTIVYFTDSRRLTADASPEGGDLYRCTLPAGAVAGCASLVDVSAPPPGSGESAGMGRRIVPALSADGSRIYFVADDVLDQGPNSQGDSAVAEEPNLYLYEAGQGVRFIATLSGEDAADWGLRPSSSAAYAADLSAADSPSGRYFAFMSARSLTGYDNSDAVSGEPTQEAFRYDAGSDELRCVSCNPSSASPAGQQLKPLTTGLSMIDRRGQWQEVWLAAVLPETGGITGGRSTLFTEPRYVLDNGRVFFNAIDALVPADTNGNWDVYQYESEGAGSCTSSSTAAAVSFSSGGCVSLISSGTAKEEAAFLDASESGNDAFFLSTAKLVEIDQDSVYDAYDARVGGVPQKLTQRSECLGEACQPAPSPPSDATPASAAFHGAGNVNPARRCPKGKRRVAHGHRSRCVARKHRKKHRNHSRSGASGGTGR